MNTLLLDEQVTRYRALDNWFRIPQGVRVADAFTMELAAIREHLSGKCLLQLGNCGTNPWLSMLKFRYQYVVTPCIFPQKSTLVASLTMLPLERDSVDCVVAPLTLEAFSGAKTPIDEIDRVLKPMGHVIFLGMNPFSFWGAALRFGKICCFDNFEAKPTSSLSIKSAMLHRGYRQNALTSFYYIPPVANEFLIKNLAFLNEMGKMIWPFPAGFYCFIAQKHEYCPPSLLTREIRGTDFIREESPFPVAS